MSEQVRDRIVGVLADHHRKPPRVLARLILDELEDQLRTEEPEVTYDQPPPEPFEWTEFRSRFDDNPLASLVDFGLATTRNRTHAAMRALGLDPTEVCAVVIEHDWLRIYGYRTPAQTMPIMEDKAS